MKDYLSELLSIQCEQAYGTAERLKATGALSDEDRRFLTAAQDVLAQIRDKFRVVDGAYYPGSEGAEPDLRIVIEPGAEPGLKEKGGVA